MTFGLRILKGNLIAISLIGTEESLRKIEFFRIIEIRIIGSFIAIDNREKSQDCLSPSNNPVVSDNRRSDNRVLTIYETSQHDRKAPCTKFLHCRLELNTGKCLGNLETTS